MKKPGFFAKSYDKYRLEKDIILDLLDKEKHLKKYRIRTLGNIYGERFQAGFLTVLDEFIKQYQNQIVKAQRIMKFTISKREKILLILKIMRVEEKIEIYRNLKAIFEKEHILLYDKIVMKKHHEISASRLT